MTTENIRAEKNKTGRASGYGGCQCCHDTWDWKRKHATMFSDGKGCFPLCEECWGGMSIPERLPYYKDMQSEWTALGDNGENWPAIEAAVLGG